MNATLTTTVTLTTAATQAPPQDGCLDPEGRSDEDDTRMTTKSGHDRAPYDCSRPRIRSDREPTSMYF